MHAKSLQLCPTLCNPMDRSPPSSPVHGALQARMLEWVTMPSSRGSSQIRDKTRVSYVSCIGRWVLTTHTTWEAPLSILFSFKYNLQAKESCKGITYSTPGKESQALRVGPPSIRLSGGSRRWVSVNSPLC